MSDLHFHSLADVAGSIREGSLSPVELIEHMAVHIERYDSTYHAYSQRDIGRALEEAKVAEAQVAAGAETGSLHGVPIAIKDLLHVDGFETWCGSTIKKGWMAPHDATVVQRLRAEGAVSLTRTRLRLSRCALPLPLLRP